MLEQRDIVKLYFCVCEVFFVVVIVIFVFNGMHFEKTIENCFLFKAKDSKLILWTSEEFAESKQ